MGKQCCYDRWPPEYNAVANEMMYERSKKHLGGLCSHYKKSCYSRGCGAMLFVMIIIFFNGMMQFVFQNISHMITYGEGPEYIETKCTTISSLTNGETSCSDGGNMKNFTCLEVKASYQAADRFISQSYILWNLENGAEDQRCAVYFKDCKENDPEAIVKKVESIVGGPGNVFKCYYYHSNSSLSVVDDDVLRKFEAARTMTIVVASGGGFLFLAIVFMIVTLCASCGCKIPLSKVPPQCVVEEMAKRQATLGQQQQIGSSLGQNNYATDYGNTQVF